jgi:microcystin-dependent protein
LTGSGRQEKSTMANPFLGEIRLFPYNFAPFGWAVCQGQILSISQNAALFSLLGTNYGGNGTTNFALPQLTGIVPLHQGNGPGLSPYVVGETGGTPNVTVLSQQMPQHNHAMSALAHSATTNAPAGQYPAQGHGQGRGAYAIRSFAPSGTQASFIPTAVATAGGNLPHNNTQVSLVMTWCIALQGIFPARN